jgi:PAS domain S-box-containing protein
MEHFPDELYKKFFYASPTGIFIYDSGGNIVHFNDAAHEMHGYTYEEMMNKQIDDLISNDARHVFDDFMETLKDGRTFVGDTVGVKKGGTTFHARVQGSLVHHEDQEYFFSAVRDVSARREIEKTLRVSEKMRALGQLTGGVAHDFNNLLMIILGNAELLEMEADDPDTRDSIELILDAATKGADLTRHLLSFSGETELRAISLDLGSSLDRLADLLRSLLPENIDLRIKCSQDLDRALVDKGQVDQVLMNIILNAKDAISGSGRIVVTCENVEISDDMIPNKFACPPGRYARISISDTGRGMDKQTLNRALEPFFTTKAVGKGTGLGLSMAYGFARQSGGDLRIYSEPGHGTTVHLYLPSCEEDPAQSAGHDEENSASEDLAGRSVLVVEDQPGVRNYVEKVLKGSGMEVTLCEHGDAALELLEAGNAFDLLFTDVVMPGSLSGPQLAEEAGKHLPEIKILFTSGYPIAALQEADAEAARTLTLLMKPYRTRDLRKTIAGLLDA